MRYLSISLMMREVVPVNQPHEGGGTCQSISQPHEVLPAINQPHEVSVEGNFT